ncbi:tRNA uridine-5-carboxymethylaminomethyl(34) synthesis GTPase MnmE [Candidatus Palibaumannia cicadellinicola]|uniref:tRNA modification GTPase MnmE n=1 Tax=Candidatus Palibaumannia cicadellinicola TaxID=186490 RepID=A0A0K2BK74_9GAMM|nr:tRNA uridine-5-carboxymethylaminomethyl(34) synthesis GTPase MnmE [Candidatus Baumannia cicadellinicola]AKZ65735.1 GTPase and tRNA-U34 5-formylation enzyme [Candidatus Baumannia cicadellinicola]
MSSLDTIIAHATPHGYGSVGIVRVSGTLTKQVALELLGKLPSPRQAEYLPFYDINRKMLDKGIAIYFPCPNSFTGEDILELHGHGGPVILEMLLQRILMFPGIRIARPGEFSERAFINNKIDLTQAEAIADIIEASSIQAARAAVNSLQGVFSKKINYLIEEIINLRLYIEANIDFPDEEEISIISQEKISVKLNQIISDINLLINKAHQSSLLREGSKIVITGKPNVGKSSIMNLLTGSDVAIVTKIAGTTRDVLRQQINLDGIPINIIDTAGLCDETTNEVERIGINRAWHEIQQADHILLIVDSCTTNLEEQENLYKKLISRLTYEKLFTIVRNKADLSNEKIGKNNTNKYSIITISALLEDGIEILIEHLKQSIGYTSLSIEGNFLARSRHIEALNTAVSYFLIAKEKLFFPEIIELLAEDLKLAHTALSEITGKFSSNDLLKRIFSRFCIGK